MGLLVEMSARVFGFSVGLREFFFFTTSFIPQFHVAETWRGLEGFQKLGSKNGFVYLSLQLVNKLIILSLLPLQLK